ncbi:MAG TPA: methyltransferase domain-containing protein, partial [Anaerolineales bacterium]|nr:methyltransferase domain-containing protein [Anaerolineales bacterium]
LTRAQWTSPRLSQAKSEHLPLASAAFDAVLSECTLSLFDTDRALAEVARVLKPGGYFIVSDLYARNPQGIDALRHLPPGSCIGSAMTQAEITTHLAHHGFYLSVWQDCSEELKTFSMCTLTTAAQIDPFDLVIASARAKLGYYFLIAKKITSPRFLKFDPSLAPKVASQTLEFSETPLIGHPKFDLSLAQARPLQTSEV